MKKRWLLGLIVFVHTTLVAEFTKNGDVVTDSISGLMWQDISNSTTYTQPNAITYCEGATTGGYSDWRLPNIYELQSIVDITKSTAPTIYATFQNTVSSYYWCSTLRAADSTYAYEIGFSTYNTTYGGTGNGNYTRCVRGGRP